MKERKKLLREEFPMLCSHPDWIYLDNAATTQKPAAVIQRMVRSYSMENASIYRGNDPRSRQAESLYEEARSVVQRWIGASSAEQIVFTKSSTEALNLAAQGIGETLLGKGDNVVVTELEHSSAFYSFREVCLRTGAEFRVVPAQSDGTVSTEDVSRLLDEHTRIFCMTAMSNVTGWRPPAALWAELAHRKGTWVMADATQAAAHGRLDVAELGCDLLSFSAHKVYGPTGCGVLYGRSEILRRLPPLLYGGGMLLPEGNGKVVWKEPPHRFEGGTPDTAAAAGLAAALTYLEERDFPALCAQEQQLAAYLREGLSRIPGLRILGPDIPSPVISFTLDGWDPYDLGVLLGQANIALRCGAHCAYPLMERLGLRSCCRVSLGIYNTLDEMDNLLARLHALAGRVI